MELVLARHGLPLRARSDDGVDPPLSAIGLDQANRLGAWLAMVPERTPDAVYTSTMRRAVETADRVAAYGHDSVHVDERLAEFDLGADFYDPPEEVSPAGVEAMWAALETGVWGSHVFDPDAFEARVGAVLDEIVANHAGQRVLVVCHGGVINSYLGRLLGRPRGFFVQVAYTSFSRVLASGQSGPRRLLSINETPHLTGPTGVPS